MPSIIPDIHLVMCSSSRLAGHPKGGCQARNAPQLVQYLQQEVADRDLPGVLVTNTGCLQLCEHGPILIVYPTGHWYGPIDSQDKIDQVLDAIEQGTVVAALLVNAD
jgi:(2Fe-2S) ferredoxin